MSNPRTKMAEIKTRCCVERRHALRNQSLAQPGHIGVDLQPLKVHVPSELQSLIAEQCISHDFSIYISLSKAGRPNRIYGHPPAVKLALVNRAFALGISVGLQSHFSEQAIINLWELDQSPSLRVGDDTCHPVFQDTTTSFALGQQELRTAGLCTILFARVKQVVFGTHSIPMKIPNWRATLSSFPQLEEIELHVRYGPSDSDLLGYERPLFGTARMLAADGKFKIVLCLPNRMEDGPRSRLVSSRSAVGKIQFFPQE